MTTPFERIANDLFESLDLDYYPVDGAQIELRRLDAKMPAGESLEFDGFILSGRTCIVVELLVKHFRRPAPNQYLILDVFQEENWPERIDDPLPRLADT